MVSEFDRYIDDLLLKIEERQGVLSSDGLAVLHLTVFKDRNTAWMPLAFPSLVERGFGELSSTLKNRTFTINGAGVSRADQIREDRRKKTAQERLSSVPRSDWIAIAAILISLVALFK